MKKQILTAIAAGVFALTGALSAHADTPKRMINVLVLANDADPDSLPASNYAARTVVDELKEQMRPYGYNIMDLDTMMANLGWNELGNRVSRRDKMELVLASCSDGVSKVCPRMVAFVETRVDLRKLGSGNGAFAFLNMNGDIVDARNGTSRGKWRPVEDKFTTPYPCANACIDRVVANNAYNVAAELGDSLRILLDDSLNAIDPYPTYSGSQPAADLRTDYVVTFRNFSFGETGSMLDIMETQFGGNAELGESVSRSKYWKQNYTSDLNNTELTAHMYQLMNDMGYGEEEFRISVSESNIEVAKLSLLR
jgi:hypothetical protein|tara:strand:+ start:4601 stop:5530 length:930 start_codon:yes stop_codon:yes gene_type:complete